MPKSIHAPSSAFRTATFISKLSQQKAEILARFKQCDLILLTIVIALSIVGIGILHFSSFALSMKYTGQPFYFVERQLIWFFMSMLVLLILTLTPVEILFKASEAFLILTFILLISVFIPFMGKSISHARRWTDLGFLPFFLQSSEMIKPFFLVFLSMLLAKRTNTRLEERNKGLVICSILLSITLIIALEPDISTASIFLLTGITLLFISNFPLRYFFGISILSLPAWIYLLQSKPYIVKRFLSLNPEADPYGSGYHIIRSLTAHRSGGWFGQATEEAFAILASFPDAHNDFSFTALTTTTGFFGAFLIFLGFIVILDRGIRITKAQKSSAKAILACGITTMISIEAILHILVTLGILPTTGTPLPFLSYGGSSLLSHFAMIGILLHLSIPVPDHKPKPAAAPPLEQSIRRTFPSTS